MKIEIEEGPCGFIFNLTPESDIEGAQLVRLKLQCKSEAPDIHCSAYKEGIRASVQLSKLQSLEHYV